MSYIEFKGYRYQIEIAKGYVEDYPCCYCDMESECNLSPDYNFCDDYLPFHIIFKRL